MTFDELQELYDRIILGLTIVNHGGKTYYIKDPGPLERLLSRKRYESTYNDLIMNNLPTKSEIETILANRLIWTTELEEELSKNNELLEQLQDELLKLEFRSNQKEIVEKNIEFVQDKISLLENKKYTLFTTTAEYLSRMESYKELIFLLTYDDENKRIWETRFSFDTADDKFIQKLIQDVFFNQKVSETNIRKLSRSEPWRSAWLGAGKVGNLFDKPMTHVSDIQRALVSWSLLYDSVFENPDKPSDDIINDDKKFDAWLKDYHQGKKNNETKSNFTENEKIANSSEIAIMVDSIEDVKAVYNLNDKETLKSLDKRDKVILEKGEAKDQDFPDVKLDLQMKRNQMLIKNTKERGNGG